MSFATLEEAWGLPRRMPPSSLRVRRPTIDPPFYEDSAKLIEARRILHAEYARNGLPGLERLLPPGVVGGGLGPMISGLFSSPEKVLLVLLLVLVGVVLFESFGAKSRAHVGPSLASYVPPYPVTTP